MKKRRPWEGGERVKPVPPLFLRTDALSGLSGSFGDLENFVNVVGENCGEVRPRVPGHVSAEREFAHILRVLHIPDLWHTAARPGGGRGGGREERGTEREEGRERDREEGKERERVRDRAREREEREGEERERRKGEKERDGERGRKRERQRRRERETEKERG